MKKYFLAIILIIVALALSACSVAIPWAPGEGGVQDGEYRFGLYDNETEFILTIHGDKAMLEMRDMYNFYGSAKEVQVSIIEGKYSVVNNNIVLTANEGSRKKEYVGTEQDIEYYKAQELAELKRHYDGGDYTKEEYEAELALINGEIQKKTGEENANATITMRIDISNNKLYMLKMEAKSYTMTYNYRQDGSLEYVATYAMGIEQEKQLFDEHNNAIEEGVIREYYTNGKVKKEVYPAGSYYDTQECILEYNEDGKLIKDTSSSDTNRFVTEYFYNSEGLLYKSINTYELIYSGLKQQSVSYHYYKDDVNHHVKFNLVDDINDNDDFNRIEVIRFVDWGDDMYDFGARKVTNIEQIEGNIIKFSAVDYEDQETYYVYEFDNDKLTQYNKDGTVQSVRQYILKQTQREGFDGSMIEDHGYGCVVTEYDYSQNRRTEVEYDVDHSTIWYKEYVNDILVSEERKENDTFVTIE